MHPYGRDRAMLEHKEDLWAAKADLRCITTNGIIKRNGEAVMGAGCALEAREAIPNLATRFGTLLKLHGNRVMRIGRINGADLASFPTKHSWRDDADPELIVTSAHQLVALADKFGYQRVVIPRPGCGNGKLKWSQVRSLLQPILDDRFVILSR